MVSVSSRRSPSCTAATVTVCAVFQSDVVNVRSSWPTPFTVAASASPLETSITTSPVGGCPSATVNVPLPPSVSRIGPRWLTRNVGVSLSVTYTVRYASGAGR